MKIDGMDPVAGEVLNRNDAFESPTTFVSRAAKNRIFLVDDHAMFRDGLKQLIDREPDLTVCGDVADAGEVLRKIEELKPDLVITDLSLSGCTGVELLKSLKTKYRNLPVLVVSMHEESIYAERALRAGAAGYLMKREPAKIGKWPSAKCWVAIFT